MIATFALLSLIMFSTFALFVRAYTTGAWILCKLVPFLMAFFAAVVIVQQFVPTLQLQNGIVLW